MKVIVIGAGIVGASAAYHLARKGADVTVVDRTHEGQATPAGAGIVCPWISSLTEDDPKRYHIGKAGAIYYLSLIRMLEEDGVQNTGYGLVGALAIGKNDEELASIEEQVRRRKSETPEVGEIRRLSDREAKALFPPLKEGVAGVYISGAARVDGALFRDALKRGAEKHGARFLSGEAGLMIEGEKVTGVRVGDEALAGEAVVFAGGTWAKELFEPFGINLEIEPERGQIARLVLPGEDTSSWPMIHPLDGHYIVPFEGSRIVVGATREEDAGFDYRMTAGGVKEILDEAISVAPDLADSTFEEIRVGFRPVGKDKLPLVGEIPSLKGLIVATGLGSLGLTTGPFVGSLAAGLALGEEVEFDLLPYEPLRHMKV